MLKRITIQRSIKNESVNILTEMMRIFSFIDMNESTSVIITFILTVFIIIIILNASLYCNSLQHQCEETPRKFLINIFVYQNRS